VLPKGISPQSILLACYRRADAAGIDRFSPHDLRRSFMADLLAAGADIVAVRRLTGSPFVQAPAVTQHDTQNDTEHDN
jgi:site-specific recombinase XerD